MLFIHWRLLRYTLPLEEEPEEGVLGAGPRGFGLRRRVAAAKAPMPSTAAPAAGSSHSRPVGPPAARTALITMELAGGAEGAEETGGGGGTMF